MPLRWKLLELVCKYCCGWIVVPPQTVTTSPTRPCCPLQNSGITKSTSHYWSAEKWSIFYSIQLLWFAKLKPESVLQHKLDLSGTVAAKRSRDLRSTGETRLPWQDHRTDEKEVPQLYGWEGSIIKSLTEVTIQILFYDNIMSPSIFFSLHRYLFLMKEVTGCNQ